MIFQKLKPGTKLNLIIQAVCMLLGTYTHASWMIRHGLLYPNVSMYSTIFWDILTVLDPLAAVLLFVRPKTGVILVAGIIFTDVLHNAAISNTFPITTPFFTGWVMDNSNFVLQFIFFLFVFLSLKPNLKNIRAASRQR